MLEAVLRGKFHQFKVPVTVKLFDCRVVRLKGSTYLVLDASMADDDAKAELLRAHDFIQRHSSPEFSPLKYARESDAWDAVVVKMARDVSWETPKGPTDPWKLSPGDAVDVVVSPGAFGKFGWCLNVKRIKRSASNNA